MVRHQFPRSRTWQINRYKHMGERLPKARSSPSISSMPPQVSLSPNYLHHTSTPKLTTTHSRSPRPNLPPPVPISLRRRARRRRLPLSSRHRTSLGCCQRRRFHHPGLRPTDLWSSTQDSNREARGSTLGICSSTEVLVQVRYWLIVAGSQEERFGYQCWRCSGAGASKEDGGPGVPQ